MKGFKTLIAAAAVVLLGVLETYDVTNLLERIPDQYEPLVISGVGLLMAFLRFITKGPVGK